MKPNKTAVLLMNVGTPDEPKIGPVWRYLTEFLNDKRVIDLPWLLRKFLVNFIIIPARVRNSTKLYKLLWTEKGSPLIFYSFDVKQKLQAKMGDNYQVFVAMRYQNPRYRSIIRQIKEQRFEKLILFPMYPHQAMSTTETTVVAVEQELKKQKADIELKVVDQFYDNPKFIEAFAALGRKYNPETFDHVVFSYHGLPNRHLEKSHPGITVEQCSCHLEMTGHGHRCYRATCYETSRLLAKNLGIQPEKYSVAFQSRLDNKWMEPFTDEVLFKKLREGKKRILVFAPAFVVDCLETIIEIGEEYKEKFLHRGGEKLQLAESLNSSEGWIETMASLILDEKNLVEK